MKIQKIFIEVFNKVNKYRIRSSIQTSLIHFYNQCHYIDNNHHRLLYTIVNNKINLYSNISKDLMSKKIFAYHSYIFNSYFHFNLFDQIRFIFNEILLKTNITIDCLNDLFIFDERQKMINDYEKLRLDYLVINNTICNDQYFVLSSKLKKQIKYLLSNKRESLIFSNKYSSSSKFEKEKTIQSNKKKELENKEKSLTKGNEQLLESDDQSHPKSKEIDVELDCMAVELSKYGLDLNLNCMSHKIQEESKILMSDKLYHSERLALAYNFLVNPNASFIQITNNIRICYDCHEFMKAVAKVRKCEIVIRDPNRIHRFYTNGECSCKDHF